jgi:hypothetical protein
MTDSIITEETDFERTKEFVLEIKKNIPKFSKNINYISQNIDLCDIEEIQRVFAYLIVGFRLTELDLSEIRKS